jgi:F-type H+-transporting ATPase subunit b
MFFETLNSINFLAAGHATKPPLQFQIDTLIFSLLIFLGLLAVLFKYAWKPIMQGLEAREQRIHDDIENARLANEKAEANLKQYEEKIAAASEEASAVLAQAKQDAIAAKDKILAEANEEAQRARDRALADINAAKDAAVRELAEKSVDSAVSLAGSIVGRSLDKKDHSQLIEKSIERFGSGA